MLVAHRCFLFSAVGKRVRVDGSEVFQLASFDFLGVSECKEITQAAADSISKYGVGACGPPGFYGTLGRSFSN